MSDWQDAALHRGHVIIYSDNIHLDIQLNIVHFFASNVPVTLSVFMYSYMALIRI